MSRLKDYKRTIFTLRLIFISFIYFLLFKKLNWNQLSELLNFSFVSYFSLSVTLVIVQAFFCSWRWCYLAKSHMSMVPPLFFTFMVYLENLFFNQFLPATIGGDVLRVIRWQEVGVGGAVAASTVFLDRLSGLNGAAIVALFILIDTLKDKNQLLTSLTAISVTLLVFCVTSLLFFIMKWPIILLPLRKHERIWKIFEKIRTNITFDKNYIRGTLLSIISYTVGGFATLSIAKGLNIEFSVSFIISLTALITLVSTIPITISGWGLREATFITILAPLGVDDHRAFLLGFIVGISNLISALPGGLITISGLTKSKAYKI